jgi:hypothetical protein
VILSLMGTKTVDDVQPKAVMTADELARWNQLPADEQLARLRAAIRRGLDSGPTDATMDQIWAKIRASSSCRAIEQSFAQAPPHRRD